MPPEEKRVDGYGTNLVVKIEGVVLPKWVAIMLAAISVLATVSFLFSLVISQLQERTQHEDSLRIEREVRILQLHAQDIEIVLKQRGIASERDFAVWDESTAPGKGDAGNKKKEE